MRPWAHKQFAVAILLVAFALATCAGWAHAASHDNEGHDDANRCAACISVKHAPAVQAAPAPIEAPVFRETAALDEPVTSSISGAPSDIEARGPPALAL